MKTLIAGLAAGIGLCLPLQAEVVELKGSTPESAAELSLRHEARAAVDRAVKWLEARQQPEGHFSNAEFPALTALPLWGLTLANPNPTDVKTKAVAFIMKNAKPNGAIYADPKEERKGGGMPNYNTALCMTALHLAGGEGTREVVLKARRYVAQGQHLGGDIYAGGFGYDSSTKRAYADLSNTIIALEALKMTQSAEDSRKAGEPRAEIDKKAAADFISSIQNDPDRNKAEWISDDPADKGGFIYQPDKTMAASFTNAAGVVKFRSYGSMTYAGLLALIYADVDKNDPRVRSAYEWSIKNWNLDENPGMGAQGLFYFYNVLAKAMHTMGNDVVARPDGTQLNWRRDMLKKLISLQKIDADGTGYWVNPEGRWWEADPVLVTSYTLIALQIALGE